ncbi:NUDIX domain-containing protein [Streptomyces sp. DT224]|uniref:NUDIX domain-containing protein n=1 Tax=Streptomyces sp. DT224 TaxID=3393426 RepID=UPI003CEB2146
MTSTDACGAPVDAHLPAVRDGDRGPEVLLSRRAGDAYATGLWHAPSGRVENETMIDAVVRETCEETGLFVRLSDKRFGRPGLLAAVTDGYGRPITREEEAQLGVLSDLDAVSGISYGAAHGDPEPVERGRRTLSRLCADHHSTPRGATR